MKKISSLNFNKGFTLIELLVVIAIIAILTAIVTANFTTAKAKARDAKRVSDIAQLQLVFEQVFDRCGKYPAGNSSGAIESGTDQTVCQSIPLSSFISSIPQDPTQNSSSPYFYSVNSARTDYVLRAKLETNSSVLLDDVDSATLVSPSAATPTCTDSAAPYYYCVQPR